MALQPSAKHPPATRAHRTSATANRHRTVTRSRDDSEVREMSLWSESGATPEEALIRPTPRPAPRGRPDEARSEPGALSAEALFSQEVHRIPLLSREQEREVAERAAGGDEQAQHTLVLSNLRLVMMAARRYRGCGLEHEDLIQEGNIGLLRATRDFDPREGVRFATYAMWWIRNAITIAIANKGRTVRLPAYVHDMIRQLKTAENTLWQQLGREPTRAEIGAKLRLSVDTVDVLHTAMLEPLSLFDISPLEESEMLLPDRHAEDPLDVVCEGQFQQALAQALTEAMGRIPPRLQTVLRLRHGMDVRGPLTLEAIGKILGVNRRRSHQLEHKAYRLLRSPVSIRKLDGFLS